MNLYKVLKHIEQMASLLFKLYVVYFVWLFIIASPQTTVANIGQLIAEKQVFVLMLSVVILVHGSVYVMGLASIGNHNLSGAVSRGSSVRAPDTYTENNEREHHD